jgi:hypothetical protein
MGEKVARSIVRRLSPMPQALSNPGVARLCPRSMLLGGNGLHKQMWELGLKENGCVSSRRRLESPALLRLSQFSAGSSVVRS